MPKKKPIDIAINKEVNAKLEEQMANKSLVVDSLLTKFFKKYKSVPQRFIKNKYDKS